jgi:hypothetical protein
MFFFFKKERKLFVVMVIISQTWGLCAPSRHAQSSGERSPKTAAAAAAAAAAAGQYDKKQQRNASVPVELFKGECRGILVIDLVDGTSQRRPNPLRLRKTTIPWGNFFYAAVSSRRPCCPRNKGKGGLPAVRKKGTCSSSICECGRNGLSSSYYLKSIPGDEDDDDDSNEEEEEEQQQQQQRSNSFALGVAART